MNLIGWDYLVGIPIHKFSSYTQLTYPMRFCFSIKLLFFQFSKLHLGSFCFVLFFSIYLFSFLFLISFIPDWTQRSSSWGWPGNSKPSDSCSKFCHYRFRLSKRGFVVMGSKTTSDSPWMVCKHSTNFHIPCPLFFHIDEFPFHLTSLVYQA